MGDDIERGRAIADAIQNPLLPAWKRVSAGVAGLEFSGLLERPLGRDLRNRLAEKHDAALFEVLSELAAMPQLGTIAEDLGVELGLPQGWGSGLTPTFRPWLFLARMGRAVVSRIRRTNDDAERRLAVVVERWVSEASSPTQDLDEYSDCRIRPFGKHVMSTPIASLAPPRSPSLVLSIPEGRAVSRARLLGAL